MSITPDEKEKRKAFFLAMVAVVLLVILSFILGFMTGSSKKVTPIIIQKNSQ